MGLNSKLFASNQNNGLITWINLKFIYIYFNRYVLIYIFRVDRHRTFIRTSEEKNNKILSHTYKYLITMLIGKC